MDIQTDFIVETKSAGIQSFSVLDVGRYDILFSFKESETASIRKLNSHISLYIEICDEAYENHLKEIKDGETFKLNSNNAQHPPLTYKIIVKNKVDGTTRISFYKINPLGSTNDNQYNAMLRTIADFNEFQLFDDDVSTYGGRIIAKFNGRKYFESILKNIHESYSQVMIALNKIEKSPLCLIIKKQYKSHFEKKQSRKSIMMNEKKDTSSKFYNERKIIDLDNNANRYLLYILKLSKLELINFIEKANAAIKRLQDRINEINDNTKIVRSENEEESYNFNMSNLRSKLVLVENIEKEIRNIANKIDKVVLKVFSDLVPLSIKPKEFLLNKNYCLIEQSIFSPLLKSRVFSQCSLNSICASSLKPTSRLFELFCLIRLFDFVESLGFTCEDDAYKDNDNQLNSLNWVFLNGKFKIILSYEVNAVDYINSIDEGVHFINESKNNSPDFYFILFVDNMPKYFMVLDAKCRKKSDIKKSITSRDQKVRNYYSFRYSTHDSKAICGKTVDCVAFLYPSLDLDICLEEPFLYWMVPLNLTANDQNFFLFLKSQIANYFPN